MEMSFKESVVEDWIWWSAVLAGRPVALSD